MDAVIAVACVALVLAQAAVLNAGGRERSKREVCLANLRSLASAWQTYFNDNKGKIPVGDVWYSWDFPITSGGPQLAWVEYPHVWPHPMPPTRTTQQASLGHPATQADYQHAIAEGTMWKYVGDYDIYRCPDGDKDQYVTYSMSNSMNCYPNTGGTSSQPSPGFTNINQIARPNERFLFLDTGVAKMGAFYIPYTEMGALWWGDLPPVRHGMGTTFVFADGHTEYRKWTDPHALKAIETNGWLDPAVGPDNCDCDLRWLSKITWGNVPYSCTNPNKHCEY